MGARSAWLRRAWLVALGVAIASRAWNALCAPLLRGYDATGHVSYALFLDLYRAIPYADQGWSFFHPPLHYLFGWALAQAGSAEVLARGLSLVASSASLLTAALAAYVVRLAVPRDPVAPLVAFLAVAFLPVHVYSSTMPGNELTSGLLGSATLALFLRNETRPAPTLGGDAATGIVAGLALLTKFSALVPLAAVLATLIVRAGSPRALARSVSRSLLILTVAGAVCAPYYARNLLEFGDPFQLSRDFALVASVEDVQPPGERGWRDLFALSPRMLFEPDPEAEHLLHSIWGSLYVNAWSDARPGIERPLLRTLVILGLGPTLLALLGAASTLRRAWRSREPVECAALLVFAAGLSALLIMAYRVPTFAMLKASYLLNLSIAYGFFVARGVQVSSRFAAVSWIALLAASSVSAVVYTPGLLRPMGGDNARMASLHTYFGAYDRAESAYRRKIRPTRLTGRRTWVEESLAGMFVEAGEPGRGRELYDARTRVFASPPHLEEIGSPWLLNRRAVAAALAGDREAAEALLERALDRGPEAPMLSNRAALRALRGDLAGAEADVAAALRAEPGLAAAVSVQARLLARRGEPERAEASRREAQRLSLVAPRGFPYGVGNGFHLNGQRFMLVIEGDELALYRPGRARGGPE